MQINYSLVLPRDALTVPIVRRLCRGAMLELGVCVADINDVSLAVTEACANVIDHASKGREEEYEVTVAISEEQCDVRIVDTGGGFTEEDLLAARAKGIQGERGRGIQLMEALVDIARFESKPEDGTIVHLQKRLELEDDSLFRQLSDRVLGDLTRGARRDGQPG
jgi:serine/threonine-protein kinase RsbW